MFRKVLLTFGLLLIAHLAAFAQQGTMRGKVTDDKGEPLISANVVVKDDDGQIIGGAKTNWEGDYAIKGLLVGKFTIVTSYVGYTTVEEKIDIKASGFTVYNVELPKQGTNLEKVIVKGTRAPVIDVGAAETGARITSDDIARMPSNSVDGIVAAVAGVGYNDGGSGSARGEEGMVTMKGGVRTRTGVNVPKEAIAEIQVVLGGTPANIGEAIGGTQIITLKPPTNSFKGVVKYETYLDYRLYNSLMFYLTGPLAKADLKDDAGNVTGKRTFLGFRLTAQGSTSKFAYYRAKDRRYKVVNDEKVMEIENAPIVYDPVNGTVNYAAEYLRDEDFVTIKRPNAKNYYANSDREANFRNYSFGLEAALDFRFSELTSLVLTGEFDYSYGPSTSLSYFPLNLHNAANGVSKTKNFMITADFTQRFKDPETPENEANSEEKSEPAVSKVMYQITAMFNRISSNDYNEKFGDDIFKYGHIGTFVSTRTPSWEIQPEYNYHGVRQAAHVQNSWIENVESFTPSPYNPILSNYTSQLYNMPEISPFLTSFDNIRYFNGLINGGSPGNVYSMFYNVGIQNTSYSKAQNNYYFVNAKAAATILGHDLEIGFQYDQYTAASYGLSAYSLWTLMRQSANAHISQLDFSRPIEYFVGDELYVDYDRNIGDGQTLFDESLRRALGLEVNGTDWLDIDRYTPDDYERFGGINMFSANELFNSGNQLVSYFGYDHTGEKYNARNWSLDDFFDPVARGHKNYQYLPAFSPIYAAGYIQDKFYFSDLIFNVGVRVDYFDGNQMVLKDPYLLYESYTVGDLKGSSAINYNTGLAGNAFPNGVQDDWVVYVDDAAAETPSIRGYRHGANWYNENGVQVSSHSFITGESGKATPYRTPSGQAAYSGNASGNHISSSSFKDYDPQIVVMPRIAFSFPVSDKSQFKANYDIIARRPSSGWQADYMSYLYMNQVSGSISNPNLKPERVTNYELGFQQALNEEKTAAISISAYYKETRDLIQLVQYAGADPNDHYYSYDNLDFKTIKGFSLSFDMRQSNNVRINANYTLQYAEGTGLSATTMSELIKEGYTTLKMLNPISDDRRHEFKANVDYRLGPGQGWTIKRQTTDKDGKARVKEIHPFENFGVNFLAVAQSGRPYTKQFSNTQQTIVGSYRGARLPWGFYFNVVVDKSWIIKIKPEGKKERQTMLNAAITVNNLFDIRNVTGVFSVTGNPSDNGYLSDPETQSLINSYLDPQSYRDMYNIMLNNNYWNWSSPRTIRLSLTYSF